MSSSSLIDSSLIETLARRLDAPPNAIREALRTLTEETYAELDREGRCPIDDLGTFIHQEDQTLRFEADESLARLVNRHYTGLAPLAFASPPSQEAPPPEETPPPEEAPLEETTSEETSNGEEVPPEEASPVVTSAIDEEPPTWQRVEEQALPPLTPLPKPPYEEAEYAVIDEDEEVEDQEEGDEVLPVLPLEVLQASGAPRLGDAFSANRTLSADDLQNAEIRPAEPPAPEPPSEVPALAVQAGDRAATSRSRRKHPSSVPWVAGLFVLLLAGGGVWYLIGRSAPASPEGAAVDTPAAADSTTGVPTAVESPREDNPRTGPAIPTADSAAAASGTTQTAPASTGFDRTRGDWALVVASRTRRADAERLLRTYRERFTGSGLTAAIVAGQAAGQTRYRVALGPFPSLDSTNAAHAHYATRVPDGAWPLRLPDTP